MYHCASVHRGSFVPSSRSSRAALILLDVVLVAGAAFALYRFRQVWLTNKIFLPVTIAGSCVMVAALAVLNYAIFCSRNKATQKTRIAESAQNKPVANKTVATKKGKTEAKSKLDQLPDEMISAIFGFTPPETLVSLLYVYGKRDDERPYRIAYIAFNELKKITRSPEIWRPLILRKWVGDPYPCGLEPDAPLDAAYNTYRNLRNMEHRGTLPYILSKEVRFISNEPNNSFHLKRNGSASGRPIVGLATIPHSQKIIVANPNNTAAVWNIANPDPNEIACFRNHTRPVMRVTVLPNENIASGDYEGIIKIWNTSNQELICYNRINNPVSCLTAMPNGNIIFKHSGQHVRIWKINENKICVLEGTTDSCACVAAASNGNIFAGDIEGNVGLWNSDGKIVQIFAHEGENISCMAATSDKKIIYGTWSGKIGVMLEEGVEVTNFQVSESMVRLIAALPNGRVACVTGDISIWDVNNRRMLTKIPSRDIDRIMSLSTMSDGTIVAGNNHGVIYFFKFDKHQFQKGCKKYTLDLPTK